MEITVAGQWELFLYAGLLGVLLGAYYDVFRIIRYLTAQTSRQIFFWDLFYFFSSGVVTFLFLLAVNYGQMRFYLLAGEMIGWCLYHLTIGEITIFVSKLVVKILQKLFRCLKKLIIIPIFKLLRKIFHFIGKPLRKGAAFLKKVAVKSKNSLKRKRKIVYTLNGTASPKRKARRRKKQAMKGRKNRAGSQNAKS